MSTVWCDFLKLLLHNFKYLAFFSNFLKIIRFFDAEAAK